MGVRETNQTVDMQMTAKLLWEKVLCKTSFSPITTGIMFQKYDIVARIQIHCAFALEYDQCLTAALTMSSSTATHRKVLLIQFQGPHKLPGLVLGFCTGVIWTLIFHPSTECQGQLTFR